MSNPQTNDTKNSPREGWQPEVDGVLSNLELHQNTSPTSSVLLKEENLKLSNTINISNQLGSDKNSPREGWQSDRIDGVLSNLELHQNTSPAITGTPHEENSKVFSTKAKFIKYSHLPYNPKLKENAKKLRKAGNLSEVLFWNKVKNNQLLNLDFERQKIIGNYIVDFYCPELGMVVEIDGESHDFKGEYDNERDNYLRSLGLKVVHVDDIIIKKDLDNFMTEFYGFIYGLKQENAETPRPVSQSTPHEGNLSSSRKPLSIYDKHHDNRHSVTKLSLTNGVTPDTAPDTST
jgi:very-short-patch-repair endonuclease